MENIKKCMKDVVIPQGGTNIYKDECIYSFENPESENGLYVCMNSFVGVGRDHIESYSEKTGHKIFLHIKHIKNEITPEKEAGPEKKIARLAIGIEGGFSADCGKKYSIDKHYSIVVLPDFEIVPLPNEDIPLQVQECADRIIKAEGALHIAELEAASNSWDGEIRNISKHADSLNQLKNPPKIPPRGWKCSKCDKIDNLWMNLTDGQILCGRRQLDGSGGNNHAMDYYKETGYPLAVKLGTITADGKADVYSYDEDDLVLNPKLVQHLAHFGINTSQLEKTDKTMAELEIDYNQCAWEYSRITESGSDLTPKFGPGYTGLKNLGNSCYLNSVMQLLMTIPSVRERYYVNGKSLRDNVHFMNVANDFNSQMVKLADGMQSGRYSKATAVNSEEEKKDIDNLQPGISPLMFRSLVGKGHSEFSTKKQQDCMEFLEHVLKLMNRNSVGEEPGHHFKFQVEDKFTCLESNKVRYVVREEMSLPLPVPLEAATNKEEVESYKAKKADPNYVPSGNDEQVHAKIPFAQCLSKLIAPEEISAFSSAVNKEVSMLKINRLKTFPDYLLIQLVKFGINENWQPVKYDVSIDMPDILDLTSLRGTGLQKGEELMPDDDGSSESQGCIPDEAIVQQIAEMGFPIEACKKGVYFTNNTGSEAALNWLMEHMDDPDFASPLQTNKKNKNAAEFVANEMGIEMITAMGFTKDEAYLALKETNNDVERAADWIFSHQPQLNNLVEAELGKASSSQREQKPHSDGRPKYELTSFISHMGSSIFVGHYICHIKKDGEWAIFNDNKVCKSENPPKDLGYIYLYKRISSS